MSTKNTRRKRPMRGIQQEIFSALLRGEKNEKSRKRNQAMARRVK